jgi:hypothetical protein
VVLQKDLSSKDYSALMMDELEDLHIAEGDLVWKALLPI